MGDLYFERHGKQEFWGGFVLDIPQGKNDLKPTAATHSVGSLEADKTFGNEFNRIVAQEQCLSVFELQG